MNLGENQITSYLRTNGDMDQRLRGLAVLGEDSGSVPSSTPDGSQPPVALVLEESDTLFQPLWAHVVHIHTWRHPYNTRQKNTQIFKK